MLALDDREDKMHNLRRVVISALLILFAASFHTIAVVAFAPWLLLIQQGQNEEETKLSIQRVVIRTLSLAVIAFVGYSTVMSMAIAIFPSYSGYFDSIWSDSNHFASLFQTLINVVFLIVGAIFLRGRKMTYAQRFSVIMLGLSILFRVVSMRMEIWDRIARFFEIYIYLMWVPEFTDEIQLETNRWIVETAVVGFSFIYMLIVLVYRPEWTRVVPYTTW